MTQFSYGKDQQYIAPQAAGTVLASNGPTVNPSYQAVSGLLPGSAKQISAAVQVPISSANLLALPTAIPLLAAPAAGTMLLLVSMVLEYIFKTTAYTIAHADNAFEAVYHGDTNSLLSFTATGFVDQAVSMVLGKNYSTMAALAKTVVNGVGIDLILAGTAPALTLGDGTLEATLVYQVVALL